MATIYHKIIQYVDTNIKETISIEEIAAELGYSANHVYKLFKLYSPYPIMEYIRRMKMYHAANEMYTGKSLYNIALDYGYETPAGFYKAFKNIFACPPSEFQKNNKMKEGFAMIIDNIKNIEELDAALAFAKELYKELKWDFGGEGIIDDENAKGKFSRQFFIDHWKKNPSLMLCAKENGKICGIALGLEDGYVTVEGDGVAEDYKNKAVHEALFIEMEKRAKALGFPGIALGISESQEEFYAKMGYIGKTLIQSEKYRVDELKAFNVQYGNHEVVGTNVYEGYINQLWVAASLLDKGLKKRFEEEIGDCWVQVIVMKEL